MILRRLRIPLLCAALWAAGSAVCLAHEAPSGTALLVRPLTGPRSDSEQALGAIALVLMLAVLTGGLCVRGKCRPAGGSRRRRSALTVGMLLSLWVWVLPWLSFHETHHALDTHESACAVVQIVHSQSGGIVPALPALVPPLAVKSIPATDPVVLSSRIAPEPAARSPPV